jgi:PAS domain S-box-containing protein
MLMIARYGLAIVTTLAMLGLTVLFWKPFTSGFPFIFLFFAVAFSSWYGGIMPGIIASLIGCAAASVFLIQDSPELATRNYVALGIFLTLSFTIGWLGATSRRNKSEYATTLASIGDCVISTDVRGKIRFLNQCAEDLLGLSYREAKGKLLQSILTIEPEEKQQTLQFIIDHVVQTRKAISSNSSVVKAHDVTPVDLSASPILKDNEKIAGVVFVFRNLTEKLLAEARRIESEKRFQAVADHAPVMIWSSGTDKKCNFFNHGWLKFTGRVMEQELGDGWTQGVHPDDLDHCLKTYHKSFEAGEPFQMEYRLRRHDGEYRWIQDRGVPIFLGDQTFNGYIGSCIDITEDKRNTEIILGQLNEKDVLLREIHHRVKNNLQIIMSLLGLQAMRAPKEFAEFLRDSQNRIRAMAIVHENLYHSENISHLDLSAYLNRLTNMIAASYLRPDQKIKINVDSSHIAISLDKAVPCGLITNEIVTNSLRHAFPLSKPSGQVSIQCLAENHHVLLKIEDTGIGLPEKIDPATADSFGLRLISLLAKQLNAELKVNRAEGTAYQIKFDV